VKRILLAAALLLLSATLAAEAMTTADLAWLGGHWSHEQNESWVEETWSDPRGGLMLGTNRGGKGGLARGFEFLRIHAGADGTLTYWASPNGAPPTPFSLSEASATHAVFVNPDHDYPVRIEYRRDGDTLTATISGAEGARPMSWTFTRRP
jgi:hypothetical protein